MPRTFEKLDPSHKIHKRLAAMMSRFHFPLKEAGVTVDVMLVRNVTKDGEEIDPALQHQGYAALMTIKINGLSDRAECKADATIKVDGHHWDEWSDERLDAILDHELTHLELKTDDDGAVVRDDINRPVLRARKHDQQYGWFNEIAKRHGEDAIEVEQLKKATSYAVQNGWLPGFSGG